MVVQVINSPSNIHKDPDARGSYASWTVHGSDFAGADIIIGPPGQEERIRLLPGGILIARACDEWHQVTTITGGHRVATVYTSKSDAASVVQNFKYMTATEPEIAKERKGKRDKQQQQVNEVEHEKDADLVEAWKSSARETTEQNSHRLNYVPDDPERLKKPTAEKKI